jgi:hypothetical protein
VTSPQSGKVTSSLVKIDSSFKHSASHTREIDNARRRSGAGRPVRDWQAGFQSHV